MQVVIAGHYYSTDCGFGTTPFATGTVVASTIVNGDGRYPSMQPVRPEMHFAFAFYSYLKIMRAYADLTQQYSLSFSPDVLPISDQSLT
jgi:hypothetical protein